MRDTKKTNQWNMFDYEHMHVNKKETKISNIQLLFTKIMQPGNNINIINALHNQTRNK